MEIKYMKDRKVYLDLLRVFAIFAMMLLHVASSNWYTTDVNSFEWQVFNFYDSAVRFCVPIFVMISGVLFLDTSREKTIKSIFVNNISRIITAYIFWSVAYSLVNQLAIYIKWGKLSPKIFISKAIVGHYHLWFLFTLVGLYLIVPFLRKIIVSKTLIEYFLVLFFIFSLCMNALKLIPSINHELDILLSKANIYFVLGYSGYFVLGHYLVNYEISKIFRKVIYLLGFISVIFTVILTYKISIHLGIPFESFYYFLMPNAFFTSVAVFVFFKYNVSRIEFKEQTLKLIFLLSKLSFCMYLVHDFINILFRLIGLSTLTYNPLLSVPLNAILVFVLSFIISLPISKIPILNKYIM